MLCLPAMVHGHTLGQLSRICGARESFVALQQATLTVQFKTAQGFTLLSSPRPGSKQSTRQLQGRSSDILHPGQVSAREKTGLHLLVFLCTLRGRLVPENHDLDDRHGACETRGSELLAFESIKQLQDKLTEALLEQQDL